MGIRRTRARASIVFGNKSSCVHPQKTVQDATIDQPSLQAIKLYPVCDVESGHFLVLATGRDKHCWMDNVVFHARLIEKDNCDRKIIIEADNFEEGLVNILIEAGIKKEDISS
jgi:hypothetical protein